MSNLKAPFPAFGGKSRVADMVWERLGDPSNFIEPFANSAAVLLRRPSEPKIETLNDLDCYVANFWRATQANPEAVAEHADWPVNEVDLHSRHRWLVLSPASAQFRERMRCDPDYFDPKIAGWWVWGACCWIGSGWCSEQAAESSQIPLAPRANGNNQGGNSIGVHAERGPELATKRPQLAGAASEHGERTHLGLGVHRKVAKSSAEWNQIPHLAKAGADGQGVHVGPHNGFLSEGNRPQLADAYARGRGIHGNDQAETCADRRSWLVDWMMRLRDRLRTVRVCCGDWKRVCDSPSVTTRLGMTGVFLDPPYSTEAGRCNTLYGHESGTVAHEVREWCLERGADPQMRICLAGYEGEGHEALEAAGWAVVAWKAAGGYGNRTKKGKDNAARERLWFSPHCLDPEDVRRPLLVNCGQRDFLSSGA